MARKKILFGVGAGIVSTGVEAVCGLISLPMLMKYLPLQEAGYWNIGTTLVGFLMLLQCGLGPTISREFAILRGKSGSFIGDSESILNMAAVRWAGLIVGCGVMVIGGIIYLGYLAPLAHKNSLGLGSAGAWLGLATATAINLAAAQVMSVLEGLGEVGWDRVLRIVFSALNLAILWFLLHSGFSLTAMGISVCAQALVRYWLSRRILFYFFPRLRSRNEGGSCQARLRSLFTMGSKLLLLSASGYVINNMGLFIMEKRFGLEIIPEYNALLRVGLLISSTCLLIPQMLYPFVARAWAGGDKPRVRRYYLAGWGAGVTLGLASAAFFLSLNRFIFPRWLGAGHYLGVQILLPILVYSLVFIHHVAQATPVLACFGKAFAIPAILNAALVFPCCYLGSKWLGPVGIPWGTVVATIIPSAWVTYTSWRLICYNTARPPSVEPSTNFLK